MTDIQKFYFICYKFSLEHDYYWSLFGSFIFHGMARALMYDYKQTLIRKNYDCLDKTFLAETRFSIAFHDTFWKLCRVKLKDDADNVIDK